MAVGVLEALAGLRPLAPDLVDEELRPIVERLAERRRTCDGCGAEYLQKQRHRRARNFCGDVCRVRHSRQSA
jgi:hypothetical protein